MNNEKNMFEPMIKELEKEFPVIFNMVREIIKQNEDMQDLLFTLYEKAGVMPDKLIKDLIKVKLENLYGMSIEDLRK
jgi:hypothetical protein